MTHPMGGPVAAVDCGTNTCRLLVARLDAAGQLVELARELQIVRLGQDVDATGRLHPDALARTFAAADRYAAIIREHRVPPERTRIVATSAARDAENVAEFYAGMQARFGVLPDIVPGAEEAQLAFQGALSGVSVTLDPVLVMDIGGGSTELVLGAASGEISRAVSLDIGSVRLTERFRLHGPVPPAAREEAIAYVDGLLDDLAWPLGDVRTFIGVAGTVTTASAVQQQLSSYDRARVHRSKLEPTELSTLLDRLAALPAAEIRQLGSVDSGRADVITAGVLIADRVARRVAQTMTVSESDILDGIALGLLEH